MKSLLHPSVEDHLDGELRIEFAIRTTNMLPPMAMGYFLSGLIAAWIAWGAMDSIEIVVLTLLVQTVALMCALTYWNMKDRPPPEHVSEKTIMRLLYKTASFGLIWGVYLALLAMNMPPVGKAMMLLIAAGMAATSVTFLFYIPLYAMVFGFLCVTPPALVLAFSSHDIALKVMPLYMIYMLMISYGSIVGFRSFVEILEMRSETEDLRVKAEAAHEAKSDFIASISYDLRTPLNAIHGFAQILRNDKFPKEPEDVHETAEHIYSSSKYLLSLINDILDLVNLDSKEVQFSPESVHPSDVFKELLPMIRGKAASKNLQFSGIKNSDKNINVDRKRLKQVLSNLVSNAVKYNHDGGEFEFGCYEAREDYLHIYVKDNGIGIPLAEQDKIFGRFVRSAGAIATSEGIGIGLYHSKILVERMGGSIGFTSVEGEGSNFWVEFTVDH